MGNQNPQTDERRPLPKKFSPASIPDYKAPGADAGHEGQPPVFKKKKEFPWMNGRREATDSDFNVNHSRVCYLFEHKRIEQRQFLAAERLAHDWEQSQIVPRASTILVGNGSGGMGSGPQDAKIAASGRYEAAMKAIGRGQDIIALVVITNMTVERASASLGFNRQRGWGRFEISLHDLADHYGL